MTDPLTKDWVAKAAKSLNAAERIVNAAAAHYEKLKRREAAARENAIRARRNTARSSRGTSSRAAAQAQERAKLVLALKSQAKRDLAEAKRSYTTKKRELREAAAKERAWTRALRQFAREWERSYDASSNRGSRKAVRVAGALKLSGAHLRAARALLKINRKSFADAIGVSLSTLSRLEAADGAIDGDPDLIQRIQENLWSAGVELVGPGYYAGFGGPGVRLRHRRARVGTEKATPPKKKGQAKKKKVTRKRKVAA